MCSVLVNSSMTSPSLLLVSTIFYQTQSHHPIILDSNLMKNFQGLILALNDIVHLCSTHWATIRTDYAIGMSNRQIRPLFSTNPTTSHTSHCNNYLELHHVFIVLYYCTIHVFLLYYCTFYSIVSWYMYRPEAIELYLAIQLFSFSAASKIKLGWVELSWDYPDESVPGG